MELKAERIPISKLAAPIRFGIEPSQHQWMASHATRVPAVFLVAVNQEWFLIDGSHHLMLARGVTKNALQAKSLWYADIECLRHGLINKLREITAR